MNAKQLITAVAVFSAAGSAFAAGTTREFQDFSNIPSTKTRAQVASELKDVRPNSMQVNNEWVDPSKTKGNLTRTRQEVRTEAAQAAKNNHVSGGLCFGG
jgi:hypothetical protein